MFSSPAERESNEEPQLHPYNTWFDPYITGRVLPTARELPRTNHYSRDDADIDRQRHQKHNIEIG